MLVDGGIIHMYVSHIFLAGNRIYNLYVLCLFIILSS